MSENPDEAFVVTHEARLIDFGGQQMPAIIDTDAGSAEAMRSFEGDGFEYNLKGVILRRPDGHQMGCRMTIKNAAYVLDYRCAAPNEWITELRRSKRLAIAGPSGDVLFGCSGLWTGDIEEVLKRFYSSGG